MPKLNPGVDAYIAQAQPFAQPILKHLRKLVHDACPDVEETLKWSCPHFIYLGMFCSMAAFKNHCTFGFWKSSLLFDNPKLVPDEKHAMGNFGRLTSLSDLPSDTQMRQFIEKAMRLNEAGVKPAPRPKKPAKPLPMPADFGAALKKHAQASAAFARFSPSHRREYIEWITEAKREETRQQRIKTALAWIAQGKSRNWKYAKC